jgi:hypothetical protein
MAKARQSNQAHKKSIEKALCNGNYYSYVLEQMEREECMDF